MIRSVSRFLFDQGGLLALAALAIYSWLAPTYIVDGDNAEFATLSAVGGAAHPPGYPLYVLYLRAMSWLPGDTCAHTSALATAILGGFSVLVVHAACRAWGAGRPAAAFITALFAGAPIVVRMNCVAEVFALNNLVAATILWLSATSGPLRGAHRVVALATVAGLGLANHHTCGLLAPIGILGVVRGLREARGARLSVAALGLGGMAVGLSPYLYLLIAPRSAVSWGQVDSLSALVAHFTRADYGGIGAFSPTHGEIDVAANLRAFAHTVGRAWLWLPAAGAIITLGAAAVRGTAQESRWSWRMLALTWLLGGPVLAGRFNVPPEGLGLPVVERFHLFAVVLLAIPAAIAVDRAAEFTKRRLLPSLELRASVVHAVALGALVATASSSLSYVQAMHSPAVEKGISNMLRSMPAGAVILESGDDISFGSHYLQDVYGVRTDVVVVSWMLTTMPWHRRAKAAVGVRIDPYASGTDVPSVRVARQILSTGRPMFMTATPSNIFKEFRSYPYGMLFRVLPPEAPMPTLDDIVLLNHDVFATFDLGYARPPKTAAYAIATHQRYVGTWMILGRALADAGRRDDARAAGKIAASLEPR